MNRGTNGALREQRLLTRRELAAQIARRSGVRVEDATRMIECLGDVVADAVAEDRIVALPKLGKITKRVRRAQRGVNFHTGEAMAVAPMEIPAIRWSKRLRETVRRGRSSSGI